MAKLEESQTGGKLVALEGNIDTISTQLRLLPRSQKILILPSIEHSLPRDSEVAAFDARAFVRSVHMVFAERTETARLFLRSSTSTHPKLVLMNGGSASATATCIMRIQEKLTEGELEGAEKIFKDIVRGGVESLLKEIDTPAQEVRAEVPLEEYNDFQKHSQGKDDVVGTRITTEETERPLNDNLPFPSPDHPGSRRLLRLSSLLSPTTIHMVQPTGNGVLTSEYGSIASEEEERASRQSSLSSPQIPRTVRTVVTMPPPSFNLQQKLSAFGPWSGDLQTPSTAKTCHSGFLASETDVEEEFEFEPDLPTLIEEFCSSAPTTPQDVVFGQARLINMQPPRMNTNRVRSLDAGFLSSSSVQNAELHAQILRSAKSEGMLRPRPSSFRGDRTVLSRIQDFETRPKDTSGQVSQNTVKDLCRPGSALSSSKSFASPCCRQTFVDRGTDAEEVQTQEMSPLLNENPVEDFKPVFPVVEDLVIDYSESDSDSILISIVRSYKQGYYPILQEETPFEILAYTSRSPSQHAGEGVTLGHSTSHLTTRSDDSGYDTRHEYDPHIYPRNSAPDVKSRNSGVCGSKQAEDDPVAIEPSTFVTRRPSNLAPLAQKYATFSPAMSASIISVQNSLRAFFSEHFPAGENGLSQYYYPVAPEMERLWKPLFGTDFGVACNYATSVDQILAFGCEKGVESKIHAKLAGQLARLGMKRSGMSRSGMVDIWYMITQLIQSSSGLANWAATANLFSDPTLLATLLVPQIETFVAANPHLRFLILKYSWDQLSTVLELQRLLGADLFQIAGVLDSYACEPSSKKPLPKTPTRINPLSNDAIEHRYKQHRAVSSQTDTPAPLSHIHTSSISNLQASASRKPSASFSKANFVLPSAATEAEVSSFLTCVSQVLIEKSSFYKAEPEIKPIIIERPPLPPTPTTPPYSQRDRDREPSYPSPSYRTPREVRDSKISRLTGSTLSTSRQTRYSYTPSIVSSIRTTATEKGKREDKEWENFYIGEEDSEDDDFDRMILGRSMARIVPEARKPFTGHVGPKSSTKKALKWLGLA